MRPPAKPATPVGALHALLLSLFSGQELLRWLRLGPDASVVPEVPGEASTDAHLVEQAVAALERRGRINAAFFVRLEEERSSRVEDIRTVAALWKGASVTSPPKRQVAPPQIPTAQTMAETASLAVKASNVAPGSAPITVEQEVILASWVHISDIHFGHGDTSHQWNQQRVLEALLRDTEGLARGAPASVPQPHFIFITGDIAFSGGFRKPATGESEYELAQRWVQQLQKSLAVRSECVFIVPGNHDVDRKVDSDVRRLLRGARAGEENLDEIIQDSRDCERLRERLARYLSFAQNFDTPLTEQFHGGLWWRRSVELEHGITLRVCGLNTALLSLDDSDQGKLRIGQRQLVELFVPTPDNREILVVLGHHPATGRWLADEKELRGALDPSAAIHLFGHLHEADSEQARHGWGTGCLRIAAGAAHAEAGSQPIGHGYNFGSLVILESGHLAVRIWPRRWSTKTQRFVSDVDNTIDTRGYSEHRLPERFRLHRPSPIQGLRSGDVLSNRYRLMAKIGRGGFGEVWKAFDSTSQGTVAVKILNPDGCVPKSLHRESFFRGAQAMARLSHPAIVAVREVMPNPDNRSGPYDFYVMDFIDAPNLSTALAGAPCSDAMTISTLCKIAEGLMAAHKRRVIHRDLKPSNILYSRDDGRVFIIDFDTVKDLHELTMTRSGGRFASTLYASPEVLRSLQPSKGESSAEIDERADVFSLGVIGIFLRTGQDPQHHYINRMADLAQTLNCIPELRAILVKACAFAMDERYAAVEEFLAALGSLQRSADDATKISPAPVGGLPKAVARSPLSSAPQVSVAPASPSPSLQRASAAQPLPQGDKSPVRVRSWFAEATGRRIARLGIACTIVITVAILVQMFTCSPNLPNTEPERDAAESARGAQIPSAEPTKSTDSTSAPPGMETESPRPPAVHCNEDQTSNGTTCVPRCPVGTKLILGTNGQIFVREGEQRDINDFCMGLTEVTVADFLAWGTKPNIDSLQKGQRKYCNTENKGRDRHPMNCVDWQHAEAYCQSIGGRLPSEWEWEWAGRGRELGRDYPWGGEPVDCRRAVYFKRPGRAGCGRDHTWEVGALSTSMPSATDSRDGLKDMSGNVWEWTESSNGPSRVIRGGGWNNEAVGDLLVSVRIWALPEFRSYDLGFRCAVNASQRTLQP